MSTAESKIDLVVRQRHKQISNDTEAPRQLHIVCRS